MPCPSALAPDPPLPPSPAFPPAQPENNSLCEKYPWRSPPPDPPSRVRTRAAHSRRSYPMALSSLGMVASSICSYASCRVLGINTREVSWRMHAFRIFPVGLLMAIMFYFGNLCYLYISLAYIQMLKTGSPILTMIALALAGLEYPSVRLVIAVLLIAAGTAVTSLGELHFSWLGFIYMLLSQLADAARLVMSQVLVTTLRFHPLEGLMHLSPACTLSLWVGTCALELPEMRANHAFALMAAKPGLYTASAFMGFLVNITSLMVIKYTGSLTLKLLGAVSNALLVFGACALFGDELTALEVFGYTVSLGGFIAYNMIKLGACGDAGPEQAGLGAGGDGSGAGGLGAAAAGSASAAAAHSLKRHCSDLTLSDSAARLESLETSALLGERSNGRWVDTSPWRDDAPLRSPLFKPPRYAAGKGGGCLESRGLSGGGGRDGGPGRCDRGADAELGLRSEEDEDDDAANERTPLRPAVQRAANARGQLQGR